MSLVWITIGGFFELHDIERFAAARDAEHRRLRCGPNQHLTLVDMRQMQIQKQGSVEAFTRLLGDPSFISRRLAFVVSVGLARSQIQRAAAGRDARFFSSMEDAEAWLQRDTIDRVASPDQINPCVMKHAAMPERHTPFRWQPEHGQGAGSHV